MSLSDEPPGHLVPGILSGGPAGKDEEHHTLESVMAQQRTHYLKTWPKFFQDVKMGRKPFEIRKNDRDFRVGDILALFEWDPKVKIETSHRAYQETGPVGYTNSKPLRVRVTYILEGIFGIQPGYVVMGIEKRDG